MLKTVQQLSLIPVKFGYNHYCILPRIISRWCQNDKLKHIKKGKVYYVEESDFIEYARFNYFRKKK